jgi:UDP-N-acetyl-D-glucosamine dehydrogenase
LSKKISVIGLGYVGLPLAINASKYGYEVLGIDTDVQKIKLLNLGNSGAESIDKYELLDTINNYGLRLSHDYSDVESSDIIVICVPTPLDEFLKPDLSYIEMSSKSIAPYIKQNTLIILESTVEPGTTRNFLVPIIEMGSGLTQDQFQVAFSPERIDPLNKKWDIRNTPKLVSGLTEEACDNAMKFYSKFIDKLIKCDSLEIAETSKLLENSFRLVNISFINEFSIFCNALGIDINKVISAAATKPYGFMSFYPGAGVGGHCIPIDPSYLANKAQLLGVPQRIIELATEVNHSLPRYFVKRAIQKIGNLFDKKILVIGISYKPNISDIRESPAISIIQELEKKGAKVFWHDDLVKVWNGQSSVSLSSEFDLAILVTKHDYLDIGKMGKVPIIDTRSSL